MKKGAIWVVIISFIVTSLIAASCNNTTLTQTQIKSTSIPTKSVVSTTPDTKPTIISAITTPATTSKQNWWDSLGKPQYGGTMNLRISTNIVIFDPYFNNGQASIMHNWMEQLFSFDWTTDPAVFNYQPLWTPTNYAKGQLAASYEMPDLSTVIVHLRQGIHWQNIPPANGREFTADDVAFHFNRSWGLGGYGFTTPAAPNVIQPIRVFLSMKSAIATDKYTVVIKFDTANVESILEGVLGNGPPMIENPEAVKQWGDLNDWHHAIGTGPFILTDFVSGSSATLVKNPNYWGYDERYPQNQLPYVDNIKYLIIPDTATVLAAMRSGKIDVVDGLSVTTANSLQKTNPELLQVTYPPTAGISLDPRNDTKPFNDIRVRKAMQMAIDLPTIASNFYAGTVNPSPQTLTSENVKGWGWPYAQWPQSLKDEYFYNPTAAKKLLADAGYPNGFDTNVVAQSIADLDLLQVVKSYLAAININMDIRVMDSTSWIAFVQTNRKHDQLAYKSTGRLGLNYPPMDAVPVFQTGASGNWCFVTDPVYDAIYNKAVATTSSLDDIKQAMIDIDKRVAEQHYAITLLEPKLYAIYQTWLKGYNGQSNSISGNGAAGVSQYFWLARFWIDEKVKKSMGH
jgi:peptide/nickel transport system substrate-binding protein